ncbi:rod shape-determining protein MreD [Aquibacillus rhizosphaerae]|uniref:Rod shape-determining protein MreD n=1 Tax=Aquibacillus rhizosphaerae TaxID=3051431 RepID=A0ABT7L724_9BACI|nr:rod shape-determining protein MreD [Aquibacillus sp. LR5S19]MDL4841665.1 rod shape-determining protein MreD [Aquibacillus sp. LR5S19]
MQRFYLPLLLLLMVVFEGVALDFVPQSLMAKELLMIPHWLLLFLVMITLFYDLENTYYSLLYAILFGLMIDITYTDVLGVYMFVYALVIYIIHGIRKVLHANFFVALLLSIIAIALADIGIYIIYFFIGINELLWNDYMMIRLIPTLIANSVFFILLYPIIKTRLLNWSQERFDSKKM